jgi:hypothetical protein
MGFKRLDPVKYRALSIQDDTAGGRGPAECVGKALGT